MKVNNVIELAAATGAVAVFLGFVWTGAVLLFGALLATIRLAVDRSAVLTDRTRRSSS